MYSYTYVSEHTTKDKGVSTFIGYLKRKEFINVIFPDKHANLKYKYGKIELFGAEVIM